VRKASERLSKAFDLLAKANDFSLASGHFWNFDEAWREGSEAARFRIRNEKLEVSKRQKRLHAVTLGLKRLEQA